MAKRKYEIKIVLHAPADLSVIFKNHEIEEFWTEKITEKMQKYSTTDIEKEELVRNVKMINKNLQTH